MAVTAWRKIAGTGQKGVSASPGDREFGVAAAAELVRALIGEFTVQRTGSSTASPNTP